MPVLAQRIGVTGWLRAAVLADERGIKMSSTCSRRSVRT